LVEKLQPEVLVVDLMIPGLNGLEVTRQVKQRLPQTRVVVLSMHANEPYVLEALKNGASGYVLKDSSGTDLVLAVKQVLGGQRYLSPPLSERAVEAYLQRSQDTAFDPYDALTEREREVLHLAAEGLSNPDIAARLSISPRTVETHRANLMRKLGLKTQTDLIRYALKRGILPMED
jgi:DNA-binding NarL/FixJ family response regulator